MIAGEERQSREGFQDACCCGLEAGFRAVAGEEIIDNNGDEVIVLLSSLLFEMGRLRMP